MKRKVSILICCHNDGPFLSQALESLYAQTLPSEQFEVVLVNDGSTDSTEETITPYRNRPNFRYLKNPARQGLSRSCNRGLEESQGKYLIRLDADDAFDPPLLEELCRPMDEELTDFVSCDRREKNLTTRQVREVRISPFNLFQLIAIGTLMRRELLTAVGGWRDLFFEEYDLYLRYLTRSGRPPVHLEKVLLSYTIRAGSMTSDPERVSKGWQQLRGLWPGPLLQQRGAPRAFKTRIIAEIGENHVGDWDRARQMVVAAAHSGADIVKFQSYRGCDVAGEDPEKEWFHRVELPNELHFELKELAQQNGVEFLSTPFTVERARFLCEELGLAAIKIASSELTHAPLLDYVNRHAQRVYLSTGMATLDEIRQARERLSQVPDRVILHCVTQYPLRDEDANLQAIQLLKEEFPEDRIGYSDHTVGILAPVLAVALGATVLEKHFTLDKSLPGTDHVLSATPEEFSQMVRWIRQAEQLLGEEKKEPVAAEWAIRDLVRGRFPKAP